MLYNLDKKYRLPVKVLIVDDEQDYREGIRSLLEKEMYFIDEAENSLKAKSLIQENKYHILLIDQHMEDLDGNLVEDAGHKLGKYIKKNYSENYIIIVTSLSGFDRVKRAISEGSADDYVEKEKALLNKGFIQSKCIEALEKRKIRIRNWNGEKVFSVEPLDFINKECKVINKITENQTGIIDIYEESWLASAWKPGRIVGSGIKAGERVKIIKIIENKFLVNPLWTKY